MTEELNFEERQERLNELQNDNEQLRLKILAFAPDEKRGILIDLIEDLITNEIEQEELCD